MNAPPVVHLNLLQRSGPAYTAAWALLAATGLVLAGVAFYGLHLREEARQAAARRDAVAQGLKQVVAQIAAKDNEQARSAAALALRKEIDSLQPRAQAAQALADALETAAGGRSDEFARPLLAMTRLAEPGLWLTALTLSGGGKRLELQGEAFNGAAVLRFARRANESLQPLTLRLDAVEMQPSTTAAAAAGAVSFRLY